ncbi:hypothetical protein HUJ05_001963 [Dendroctonus ponderosae]|nr:hypothetical protein HUJ05_001963 [Dendroctonus ponderosae]
MHFTFSKHAIQTLICIYEKYPECYDSNLPAYRKKHIKRTKMQQIHDEFKEVYPEATLEDVQKKIANLRTQYFNESKKRRKSMLSGNGQDDIYKPSWWCFDLLTFLVVNNARENGESNLPPQEEEKIYVDEKSWEEDIKIQMLNSDPLSPVPLSSSSSAGCSFQNMEREQSIYDSNSIPEPRAIKKSHSSENLLPAATEAFETDLFVQWKSTLQCIQTDLLVEWKAILQRIQELDLLELPEDNR